MGFLPFSPDRVFFRGWLPSISDAASPSREEQQCGGANTTPHRYLHVSDTRLLKEAD
jgi:hypothetical protein